jgi:hypothetical protein
VPFFPERGKVALDGALSGSERVGKVIDRGGGVLRGSLVQQTQQPVTAQPDLAGDFAVSRRVDRPHYLEVLIFA